MKKDLTKGSITSTLVGLSLPIIMTNFIQTAYSMVDMIWIGKLGSDSLAAVGTASIFTNFTFAIFSLIIIGTSIKLVHSIGAGEKLDIDNYIYNGFVMSLIMGIVLTLVLILFRKQFIDFYNLSENVSVMAERYLVISSLGIIIMYMNSLFSTIFNAFGNSKLPFKANSVGFVLNIVLDPILIFGLGSFSGLGVVGAALATLSARTLVFIILIALLKKHKMQIDLTKSFDIKKALEVVKIGVPVTAQRVAFNLISMYMARIVADFGSVAIAVQKIGLQIESISYMTIGGLQGAISVFVGQNYGAGKFDRIKRGYKKAFILTSIFGAIVGGVFMIFPKQLFSIFIDDINSLEMGVNYMRILGFSQLFMCIELLTVGAFNGIGKTYIPPIVSILFSALRIPVALILSADAILGLNGVWLSISVSSVIKGVVITTWFLIVIRKFRYNKEKEASIGLEKEVL